VSRDVVMYIALSRYRHYLPEVVSGLVSPADTPQGIGESPLVRDVTATRPKAWRTTPHPPVFLFLFSGSFFSFTNTVLDQYPTFSFF
jgi:hypothetical protein